MDPEMGRRKASPFKTGGSKMKIAVGIVIVVLIGIYMLAREFGRYTEDISQRNWWLERKKEKKWQ